MAPPNKSVITTNWTRCMKSGFGFSSDESISRYSGSDEIQSEGSFQFQKRLPMKKRHFGIGNLTDSQEEYRNPWVGQQQKCLKTEETEDNNLLKPEPKKAKILPGVIRHTSRPHSSLAYYYNYSLK